MKLPYLVVVDGRVFAKTCEMEFALETARDLHHMEAGCVVHVFEENDGALALLAAYGLTHGFAQPETRLLDMAHG